LSEKGISLENMIDLKESRNKKMIIIDDEISNSQNQIIIEKDIIEDKKIQYEASMFKLKKKG
jgi:hypothetical protein